MAEGREDGLEDGVGEREEGDDEEGDAEVVGGRIVVAQLFGAVGVAREGLSE